MTKIREILFKNTNDWENVDLYTVETAIKKYAECYAAKCLKIASDNAKTKLVSEWSEEECVDKESIYNIKLPNHE